MKLPKEFVIELGMESCYATLNKLGTYSIGTKEYSPSLIRSNLRDRIWKMILFDKFEFMNHKGIIFTAHKIDEKYEVVEKNRWNKEWFSYEEVYQYILDGKWIIIDEENEQQDIINKPSHYHKNGIDVNGYLEKHFPKEGEFTVSEGFYIGNVLKYTSRYKYKNGLEDLEKAMYYLSKLIDIEKGKLPS
ncbi:MAG: DUF3310 domain-containing protein [Niallia sp.]